MNKRRGYQEGGLPADVLSTYEAQGRAAAAPGIMRRGQELRDRTSEMVQSYVGGLKPQRYVSDLAALQQFKLEELPGFLGNNAYTEAVALGQMSKEQALALQDRVENIVRRAALADMITPEQVETAIANRRILDRGVAPSATPASELAVTYDELAQSAMRPEVTLEEAAPLRVKTDWSEAGPSRRPVGGQEGAQVSAAVGSAGELGGVMGGRGNVPATGRLRVVSDPGATIRGNPTAGVGYYPTQEMYDTASKAMEGTPLSYYSEDALQELLTRVKSMREAAEARTTSRGLNQGGLMSVPTRPDTMGDDQMLSLYRSMSDAELDAELRRIDLEGGANRGMLKNAVMRVLSERRATPAQPRSDMQAVAAQEGGLMRRVSQPNLDTLAREAMIAKRQQEFNQPLEGVDARTMANIGRTIADFAPGIGDALAISDTVEAFRDPSLNTAAKAGALGVAGLSMVPMVGDALAKGAKAAAKAADIKRVSRNPMDPHTHNDSVIDFVERAAAESDARAAAKANEGIMSRPQAEAAPTRRVSGEIDKEELEYLTDEWSRGNLSNNEYRTQARELGVIVKGKSLKPDAEVEDLIFDLPDGRVVRGLDKI